MASHWGISGGRLGRMQRAGSAAAPGKIPPPGGFQPVLKVSGAAVGLS